MNTMNKKHAATLLGCIALLFSSAMAVSVDGQNPVSTSNSGPQKLDLEKKTTWNNPSTIPDRIVLTVTENPATSLAITWRSNTFMKKAYVEFAIAEDGPKFVRKLVRQVASTERLQTKYNKANYHSITLENLKPETKYVYRVGFKEHWSEFSHFTTASKQTKPFSFIYFGDAQNDLNDNSFNRLDLIILINPLHRSTKDASSTQQKIQQMLNTTEIHAVLVPKLCFHVV